jgi:hypothetical protein
MAKVSTCIHRTQVELLRLYGMVGTELETQPQLSATWVLARASNACVVGLRLWPVGTGYI